jgi:hypothetical protein
MKKLFLSAFAVSLIFFSLMGHAQTEGIDDFLGLETELLPELHGHQKFTTSNFHEQKEWKVEAKNVIKDVPVPNKGQGYSIIPWSTLEPENWLSINTWLSEREIKDQVPDWKIRQRRAEQHELAGKVLQCRGVCSVYRGSNKAQVQHLSRILEGDEIQTEKDSIAWIYMMDGSLMRISPETSISINEFNIGKSEFFVVARLNQGHIFWHPRDKTDMTPEFLPETDSVSLPLMVREANQAYFERQIFNSQDDQLRLNEVVELDEVAIKKQFEAINQLRSENNSKITIGTRFMMVSPNATIVSKNAGFDYLYLPGGKGYFKKRTILENENFVVQLRGYVSNDERPISNSDWYEVSQNGRGLIALDTVPGVLQVAELLTKRIKTLELSREIWVKDFTVPVLGMLNNPKLMARDHGYSVWGDEIDRRYSYLSEYTRRIETTNLRSLENLLVKLEDSGEKISREISADLYHSSLNHYLLGLKSRYDNKQMKVREMNDLQYYVWILKNGKK